MKKLINQTWAIGDDLTVSFSIGKDETEVVIEIVQGKKKTTIKGHDAMLFKQAFESTNFIFRSSNRNQNVTPF